MDHPHETRPTDSGQDQQVPLPSTGQAAIADAIKDRLQPLLAKILIPFKFYYHQRHALWLCFAAQFSLPMMETRRRCEVTVPGWETSGGTWSVALYDCCAVCGDHTSGPPRQMERRVYDVQNALWSPAIAFAVGLVIWMFGFSNFYFCASLLAGIVAGWILREERTVRLQVPYCPNHDAAVLPELRVYDGDLFVMFGCREAKVEYLNQQRPDRVETKPNLCSPIAGLDPAVKNAEAAARTEAAKRLRDGAFEGTALAGADRRYARRRYETIPKPIRFPEPSAVSG